MVTIRTATHADDREIHRLIHDARLNPLGIDWRRFRVAVDPQGRLIGCGQVKPHCDGSRELASIVVHPQHRQHGVGRAIVEHLLAENPGVLYLITAGRTGSYYEPFGFHRIAPEQMPPYFRRIYAIFSIARHLFFIKEELLVMRRMP